MTETVRPRRPVVAALLSLVLPGLGQLYNGMARRAAVFYAVSIVGYLVLIALTTSPAIQSGTTFMLAAGLFILGLLFLLFAVFDAYAGARRTGELALRRYNRWYVYALLAAISVGLNLTVDFTPIQAKSYRLPAASMAPTLMAGDRIAVAARAYDSQEPARGDIVVFELANGSGAIYVKRLVGLPGESIQVSNGILHINGVAVTRDETTEPTLSFPPGAEPAMIYLETFPDGRSHLIHEFGDTSRGDNTRAYNVPADHYFMMGDNRDNSSDSRFPQVGFIPRENLRGRALYIWWARDLSRIGPLSD